MLLALSNIWLKPDAINKHNPINQPVGINYRVQVIKQKNLTGLKYLLGLLIKKQSDYFVIVISLMIF